MTVNPAPAADAFVFFGATGDLASKQIFPALQALIRGGRHDLPIIGVAKSGWNLEWFKEHARESLARHGGVDERAFARLCTQLHYIDGDYRAPPIFAALREALVAPDTARYDPGPGATTRCAAAKPPRTS